MRRTSVVVALAAALAALVLAPAAALAADTQIVVYNKGKTLRYDPDVGAELKEVFLETYDCVTGKLAKKETIEAYFHLSDDKEVITPDAICDKCRTKFLIEKKGEKYYFGGVRDKPATMEEANEAAPPPTAGEGLRSLESKVKKIAQELCKIEHDDAQSATKRTKIITAEFTTSLQNFGEQELTDVAGFVLDDKGLDVNQKYYVLRSFGYTFQTKKPPDFKKAVFFYDKCIELVPDVSTAYLQKAVALEGFGESERAIETYVRALAVKPRDATAKRLSKLLGKVGATSKLNADKIAAIKTRLDGVSAALAASDSGAAGSKAKDLQEYVDEALKAGGGAPEAPAGGGPKIGPLGPDGGPGPGPGGETPPPG